MKRKQIKNKRKFIRTKSELDRLNSSIWKDMGNISVSNEKEYLMNLSQYWREQKVYGCALRAIGYLEELRIQGNNYWKYNLSDLRDKY